MTAPGIRWSREFIQVRKRGAMQIMIGRPRKSGQREANGRITRTYVNPKAQVCAQPHRILVMAKYRDRPEASSNFGRMMLRGVVTPAQFEAGSRYARLAASYRAVWDFPRITPSGIDLTNPGASVSQGMASEDARKIKERYDAAFERLGDAGNRAQRVVKDCAVFDRKLDDFVSLDLLRSGLDKLVHHFGIDPELSLDRKR